jgi:hypothetical protein
MFCRKSAAAICSGLAAFWFPLAVLAPAIATGASPTTAAQERATAAQEFVGRALHLWQTRLDLDDWKLRVQLVRSNELEPKTLGNIHWDTDTKEATIDVLSSYDYALSTTAMLDDMEFTIVHELVHLQLASLPHSEATRGTEERAVNRIARALLKLSKP